MTALRFYVLFNSISIIYRMTSDNDCLCAMEPCLRLEKFRPPAWLELMSAKSIGQHLTGASVTEKFLLTVRH